MAMDDLDEGWWSEMTILAGICLGQILTGKCLEQILTEKCLGQSGRGSKLGLTLQTGADTLSLLLLVLYYW